MSSKKPATPLTALAKLSVNARQALVRAGISTLEAAVALSDEELLALKGLKQASLQRLRAWQRGDPEEPSRAGDGKEKQDRLWTAFMEYKAQGLPSAEAWKQAEQIVTEFYQQMEAQG